MKRRLSLAFAALVGSVHLAAAAPIVFENRDDFVAATAPQANIDFEGIDYASFQGTTTSVANMQFSGFEYPEDLNGDYNYIGDDCPLGNWNGSDSHICALVFDTSPLRIDFLTPVLSWGADFRSFADNTSRNIMQFYDAEESLLATIKVTGTPHFSTRFFGIDLDGAEASFVEFYNVASQHGTDAFMMDNVLYSADRGDTLPPVPLPASLPLLVGGGLAFAAFARRRS